MKFIFFIEIIICFILSSISTEINAKNERALIFLKSGVQIEADIEMPKINTREITYRNEKRKKVKIASDSILFMRVWNKKALKINKNKEGFHMIYSPYYRYEETQKKYELQESVWMIKAESGLRLSAYVVAGKYLLKGKYLATIPDKHSSDNHFKYYYWSLFQHPNEEYPTLIFKKTTKYKDMPESMFYYKNYGKEYFKDCPKFIKFIDVSDFKPENFFFLAKYYDKYCR